MPPSIGPNSSENTSPSFEDVQKLKEQSDIARLPDIVKKSQEDLTDALKGNITEKDKQHIDHLEKTLSSKIDQINEMDIQMKAKLQKKHDLVNSISTLGGRAQEQAQRSLDGINNEIESIKSKLFFGGGLTGSSYPDIPPFNTPTLITNSITTLKDQLINYQELKENISKIKTDVGGTVTAYEGDDKPVLKVGSKLVDSSITGLTTHASTTYSLSNYDASKNEITIQNDGAYEHNGNFFKSLKITGVQFDPATGEITFDKKGPQAYLVKGKNTKVGKILGSRGGKWGDRIPLDEVPKPFEVEVSSSSTINLTNNFDGSSGPKAVTLKNKKKLQLEVKQYGEQSETSEDTEKAYEVKDTTKKGLFATLATPFARGRDKTKKATKRTGNKLWQGAKYTGNVVKGTVGTVLTAPVVAGGAITGAMLRGSQAAFGHLLPSGSYKYTSMDDVIKASSEGYFAVVRGPAYAAKMAVDLIPVTLGAMLSPKKNVLPLKDMAHKTKETVKGEYDIVPEAKKTGAVLKEMHTTAKAA